MENGVDSFEDERKEKMDVQIPCLSSIAELEKLVTKLQLKLTRHANEFLLLTIMKQLGAALSQQLVQSSE